LQAAGRQHASQSEQNARGPNRARYLQGPARDHEFAVLLGDKFSELLEEAAAFRPFSHLDHELFLWFEIQAALPVGRPSASSLF